MLTENLSHLPDDTAVLHHPLVKAVKQRAKVNHVLRLDCHQLVVKGTRRTEEVGIHLVVQEHVQLVKHRVGIRAAIPRASNYLRVRIHLGEFRYKVFGCHGSEGVVATGLLAAAVSDEVFIYKGGNVALNAFGGDAGGGGDLRDGVAGVGGDAGEDDALGSVDAGDGADDAVLEADGEVAWVVVEELGVDCFILLALQGFFCRLFAGTHEIL